MDAGRQFLQTLIASARNSGPGFVPNPDPRAGVAYLSHSARAHRHAARPLSRPVSESRQVGIWMAHVRAQPNTRVLASVAASSRRKDRARSANQIVRKDDGHLQGCVEGENPELGNSPVSVTEAFMMAQGVMATVVAARADSRLATTAP
jgi:hypothetical protein